MNRRRGRVSVQNVECRGRIVYRKTIKCRRQYRVNVGRRLVVSGLIGLCIQTKIGQPQRPLFWASRSLHPCLISSSSSSPNKMSYGRRMSMASNGSDSGNTSPVLPGLNSSTSLVLVHDDEEYTPFNFPNDNDDDEEDDRNDPQFEFRRAFCPPLPPSTIFLYLLSPYLKLGAMCLPNTGLPLKYGLPALFIFAVLSAFSRQIWYMLSRYIRKADLEEVILDSFARGRGKETSREILRSIVRAGTGLLRVLLSTIYLHGKPSHFPIVSFRLFNHFRRICPCISAAITREITHPSCAAVDCRIGLGPPPTLLGPIPRLQTCHLRDLDFDSNIFDMALSRCRCACTGRSRGERWLAQVRSSLAGNQCVIFHFISAQLTGHFPFSAATAFAFTSSPTLSLYASLKGSIPPISTAKKSLSRSFKTLSILSVAVAAGLILPLVFFAASPNTPEAVSLSLLPLRLTSKTSSHHSCPRTHLRHGCSPSSHH